MTKAFKVSIARPGRYLLTYEATDIKLPSNKGFIGIMADRKPLLVKLDAGVITLCGIHDDIKYLGTTGGFAEFLNNNLSLLCDWIIDMENVEHSSGHPQKPFYFKETDDLTEEEKREYVKQLLQRQRRKIAEAKRNN